MNAGSPVILGVLGHYGNRNLGDEASISSLLDGLRRLEPEAVFRGYSLDPADTAARYAIPAYPIRRSGRSAAVLAPSDVSSARLCRVPAGFSVNRVGAESAAIPGWRRGLKRIPGLIPLGRLARGSVAAMVAVTGEIRFIRRSLPALRNLDLLLIAGSNQFEDKFGGLWGFPYTLLKWALMARLQGVRVCFVSVGARALNHAGSGWAIRCAVALADFVSFRDERSRVLVRKGRVGGAVYPDLAHALSLGNYCRGHAAAAIGRRACTVAINLMPVHDPRYWPVPDARRYAAYVACMSSLVNRLAAGGYRIVFFAMQPADDRVIEDVRRTLSYRGDGKLTVPLDALIATELSELLALLLNVDAVVATRFHGVLLSLVVRRPVLALCYEHKTMDLMNAFGLGGYATQLGKESPARLHRNLERLLADEHVPQLLRTNSQLHRMALERQFDLILSKARECRARRTAQDAVA
ncbi:MAG: polysaccharide pyruvyl transferase family protein [Aquisalimonadaceae bacterium]